MTPQLLEEIGLNATQARTYLTLVESGSLPTSTIAEKTTQQRTTVYMALQSLEKLGLVELTPNTKVKEYRATNPIALEKLSEQRRKAVLETEHKIKQSLPAMLSYYYSFTERPGVRMVEGIDGLKEIYRDTLRAKKDIHLLRTRADIPNLTEAYLDDYRQKRADRGIHTFALTPDSPEGRRHMAAGDDTRLLYHRVMLPPESYTAPVEVDVYGDKTAFMMFGEEIMGIVVNSPALAQAMRQMLDLLRTELTSSQAPASPHAADS